MASVLLPLALAQTIIWASTFYLFPALLPTLEKTTIWTKPELTGAYTLSLLATALASPLAGRFVDRNSGPPVVLAGIFIAALALCGLSQVEKLWQFYALWLIIGACMGAILYETCFAIITRAYGTDAKPLITRITLIAGLAGTVSFPCANWLSTQWGWQTTVLVAGLSLITVAIPLTIFGLNELAKRTPVAEVSIKIHEPVVSSTTLYFWLIAICFTLVTMSHMMIVTHLIPMLTGRGVMQNHAVLAASLIGPMQIVGRLIMMSTEHKITTYSASCFCFVGMAVAAVLLAVAGAEPFIILGFVVFHGASWGTLSILRPALTREVMGPIKFGLNSGRVAAMAWLGSTIAPFGGALLWNQGGYILMLIVCIALTTIASALLAWLGVLIGRLPKSSKP